MTDNNDSALIVFVKNPVIGKVKTRLAATIGDQRALEVYLQLLGHTMTEASNTDAHLVICYSDFVPESDTWSSLKAHRCVQVGGDLGACMHNALSEALNTYKRAILIGSDCSELTTEILNAAIKSLMDTDVFIGPALDGGYYLVGATQPVPGIFENVDWSTEHVLHQTLSRLLEAGLNFGLGITLRDVDDEGDLEALRASDA